MPESSNLFLFVLLGLFIGFLLGWLLARLRFGQNIRPMDNPPQNLIPQEVFQTIEKQLVAAQIELREKNAELLQLEKQLAIKDRDILYLEEKIIHWKKDFDLLQERARLEFENVANRILEEKTKKFTHQNEKQLTDLLHPLRENIKDFSRDMERRFSDESKDKVSLKKEIEQLKDLNLQLSSDAQLLAAALKGDSKVQGDWGEFQLEVILEKAGLTKGLHFRSQPSFKDENGFDKRPDFIINLPDGKHLVVDSKVSLTAYERYFNAKEDLEKKKYIEAHLQSVRAHIRDLSSKQYQHLYQINSPDYLLLFIPIEPAFALALHHDSKLFLDALDKNIVLVTTSTLLATMRTVSYIWRQDKQQKNVLEIARQSGMLYDKFVGFVDDLNELGSKLSAAQSVWDAAMNKLSDSKKYGDTLIGRAEKIKKLGAKTTKDLPRELVDSD